MKKSYVLIAVLLSAMLSVKAQTDHRAQFANKVAQRMKDSLGLTGQQKNQLANISLSLENEKKTAMQQHPGRSAIPYVQQIENKRDSLYKLVLPQDKYILYKQKKHILVNNN